MKKIQIIFGIVLILLIAGTVVYKKANHGFQKTGRDFITDSRDGQTYKIVKIGNQTWMAQDLNYETANSYCFNNSADNCAKYGRLYTWAAAIDSVGAFSTNGAGCGYGIKCNAKPPIRGICPEGWHLPTAKEWEVLLTTIGGKRKGRTKDNGWQYTDSPKLLSKTGWYKNSRAGVTGTDDYGFSATPSGMRTMGGIFTDILLYAHYWCADEKNIYEGYETFLSFGDLAGLYEDARKYTAFSVRCLKDDSSSAGKDFSTPTTTEEPYNESDAPQTTEVSFTSSGDKCKDKTEEAKAWAAKCRSIEKGTDEYKDCANSYKRIKNQAVEACHVSLDEKELRHAVTQWEKQVNNCQGKQNARCASALQQLGHYQFQLEEKLAINHKKSLDYFLEFIEKYPNHSKTPSVLFQIATIERNNGKSKRAYSFYVRIVKEFPDNGLAHKARFHIGEYHYNNRNYRDAINAFKGIANFIILPSKEGAFAMFHLAQSYYNIKDYSMVINTLYQYIKDIDKGQYSNDLRPDAIDLMAKAFKRMKGNSLKQAEVFFSDKNASFDKEVYQLIQEN